MKNSILKFLENNPKISSKELFDGLSSNKSYATLKRELTTLLSEELIQTIGKGKGTKYLLSENYELLKPINLKDYYQNEIDDRSIIKDYNFSLLQEIFPNNNLFSTSELNQLTILQEQYKNNSSLLTPIAYKKELDRLAIDLSWKSSQIEGNTYSLLETEHLLTKKETAAGKTKEEAIMLLNHKNTLDFIINNPGYLHPLSLSKIEDIHSLLVKDLQVERNIRKRRIGISGTNYKPLDNEFQIREALISMCSLINLKENVFEKVLISLLFLSYIQAFSDGNKRTARIISNAILIREDYCPISFRTISSIDYKKAMLLFYEQNNISAFKAIFINQFKFAVKTYF